MRTLPERFANKVAATGEAKNLETMKLEELIGSLRTFEMELKEDKKQGKRTTTSHVEPQQVEGEEGGDLVESMALLTKNFNQVARKMNKRLKGTYQSKNITFSSNPLIPLFKANRFSGVNPTQQIRVKEFSARNKKGMAMFRLSVPTPARKTSCIQEPGVTNSLRNRKSLSTILWS